MSNMRLTILFIALLHFILDRIIFSLSSIIGNNHNIPIMAAKESCAPIVVISFGYNIPIVKAQSAILLHLLLLRQNIVLREYIIIVIEALIIEGAPPVKNAYMQMIVRIIKVLYLLNLNEQFKGKSIEDNIRYIIPICSPDNARTCITPALEYDSFICSGISFFTPRVSAHKMECSSGSETNLLSPSAA